MDDKTLSDFLPSSKNADGIISFGTPLKKVFQLSAFSAG